MRLPPRSLAGRLLVISVLTTLVALALAAVGIGHVLERFVMQGFDSQLDAEIAMLGRALRPDGSFDRARVADLPAFARGSAGWGWRIETPRGAWVGGDPVASAPLPPGSPHPGDGHDPAPPGAIPGEGRAATGLRVHTRTAVVPTPAGDAIVTAGGPRRIATAPLREAMVPLLGSLALLGLVLALAIFVQLRLGLRPLRALGAELADVRAGRARHVPADQPSELAPLASELNALVDQNAAQLEQARRHVANLAHGLKTPLAALALRLAENGHDADGSLAAMVADIDARIRHHLGRARAASLGDPSPPRSALAPNVADLVVVMRGIHAERAIVATIDVPPDLVVAADPQDLDEMLGNLFDNAWRHARTRVAITARRSAAEVEIAVRDDGPGLSAHDIDAAMMPGRRLDERGNGHGFGLPITLELAALNGGALRLDPAIPNEGLAAVLTLPSG